MDGKMIETQRVTLDRTHSLAAQVSPFGVLLRAGGLVAFPTETVYGLGANGLDGKACSNIYLAKGRPSDNPLILHVTGKNMLNGLVRALSPLEEALVEAYWPGPLTLVLPRTAKVPDQVTGGGDTVGVRAPREAVAQSLIAAAEVPLAAPSANLSGRPSPTTAAAVAADLDGRVDAIIDGGPCEIGLESTVVSCAGGRITVYRPGAITPDMLRHYAPVELDTALVTGNGVPKAPGMKYRHYAPHVPVTVYVGAGERIAALLAHEYDSAQGYFVSAETARLLPPGPHVYVWGERADAVSMAAELYAGLLYLDHQPIRSICAEGIAPSGLGLAIMNRLTKAAGYRLREVP